MEFSTPNAIREIKANTHKKIWVDGQKQCPLQAMSFAFKYHKLDITDSAIGLNVRGTVPVIDHKREK